MNEILTKNPVVAIIFVIAVVVVAALILIKVMQTVGMEKVRSVVYQGFIQAENQFKYGDNQAKFDYVVNLAKSTIPAPFNFFITESLLRKIIQTWFDVCKDFLDDGKLNGKDE